MDRDCVTLRVSGSLQAGDLVEIQNALTNEGMNTDVVVDLSEVTLISREAIKYLARCEINRIDLRNSPAYIRNWIVQERKQIGTCGDEKSTEPQE